MRATTVPSQVAEWSLGRGEAAVIAVALQRGRCVAVLDDALARRCARTLGVPVVGTLGAVLMAKRHGRIESAAGVLRALRDADFFLDDATVSAAVLLVGEDW